MKPPVFAYFFLLFLILNFEISNAGPPMRGAACIQGNIHKLQLHRRIAEKSNAKLDTFLGYYQRERDFTGLIEEAKDSYLKSMGRRPFTPSDRFEQAMGRSCTYTLPMINMLQEQFEKINGAVTLPQISNKCIRASLRRSNNTKGWSCESETSRAKPIGSAGVDGPCITAQVSDYLTWAVNKAIACLNDPDKPIDVELIYKKLNNETGFSFFSASGGGVGIGQLTTDAIEQINKNTKLVERVFNSPNPACRPFAKAMGRKPRDSSRYCEWLDPSEGVARNLIYSIGYFLNSRDVLAQELNKGLTSLGILDARYYNVGALATYGKGGLTNQTAIVDAARQSPHNFADFLSVAKNSSLYIQQIESKYQEALQHSGIKDEPYACLETPQKMTFN